MGKLSRLIWVYVFGIFAITAQYLDPGQALAAENLSGHWHLVFYAKCANNPANARACAAVQAPAHFPIFGVPKSTLMVKGVGDYFSNRAGRYTVRFVTAITERAPGAVRVNGCDNAIVFASTFNGTCRENGTGHGHIAKGATGMDDFWQDDTAGFWNGNPPARFAESARVDTFNPACPGVLDTRQFLKLFGFRSVPAGITARLVLTHHLSAPDS